MRLRHTTPTRNITSIRALGLLCAKAQGRMRVVWLHAPGRSAWATLHVSRRQRVPVEDTVTFEMRIPRSVLRKSGRPGLWYTFADVLPELFTVEITFDEVCGAGVEV